MEFSKYKCPVCGETFKPGDDVVVCPECGAPHHRECYEQLGHCCFEEKHSNNFSLKNTIKKITKKQPKMVLRKAILQNALTAVMKIPKPLFYAKNAIPVE